MIESSSSDLGELQNSMTLQIDQNMKTLLDGDQDSLDPDDLEESCENVMPEIASVSKVKSSPGTCLASKRKSH